MQANQQALQLVSQQAQVHLSQHRQAQVNQQALQLASQHQQVRQLLDQRQQTHYLLKHHQNQQVSQDSNCQIQVQKLLSHLHFLELWQL